ncbi:hypothetical protein [Halorussus amylolyticus]|uniref:hypothetical protein n=1 Tax=Halorussus amylolyticus TaxID=1126242 RepID=UPI00104C3AA4|nr:hypothetical protein [Halorussus amylolyticus]
MGTSDIAGKARRFDRWLGAQYDRLLHRKHRVEAAYCERRAERARARGDLGAAADYYERASGLRGRLGDHEASAELGMELGAVARETGDLDAARREFERVAELHSRRRNAPEALDAMEAVVEVADEQADDDGLAEWWGNVMMVLGQAEASDIDDARRDELVAAYADRIHSEDSAGRLYGFALDALADGDDETGERLLDATWERREVVREEVDVFRVVLAAGVGRVAHAETAGRDIDRDATLDFVADHREKLSEAATALFARLRDGATDTDPETLRADFDPDEPADLRTLEGEVFGRFLEEL